MTARVLCTSGFHPVTLATLRQRWEVIDIPQHRDALAYLRQASPLPDVMVIGYAVLPASEDQPLPPEPTPTAIDLPAHEMLERTLAVDSDMPVIISTSMAESDAIVFLIKRGAFDYVVEPSRPIEQEALHRYTQRLVLAISRAVRWRQVLVENRQLRHSVQQQPATVILGRTAAIQRVTQWIGKVAPTPATVLVSGESGTGKELVARAIHEASDRRDQPFLGINCGALEDTLLRSELFGHERGAFTGAETRHPGLIREAGGGTLFLDEIAGVSHAFQVALLRVLEERVARPVGGSEHYPVRCRIVAASNCDLAELVADGRFRRDLYYRLNVFQIRLPPLRERRLDIPVLARHFLDRMKADYGKPDVRFSHGAMEALERYNWPGNVRELRNVIERALILCDEAEIRHVDLGLPHGEEAALGPDGRLDLREAIERLEKRLIREALARSGDNLAAAARLLNVKRPTLHYRIRQLGIHRP